MRRTAFLILAVPFAISAAFAHDTWLIPNHFRVKEGVTVTFDLTSGMAFPALEVGPKPERVEKAQCRLTGKTIDLTQFIPGPKSLQIKSPPLTNAGIAKVWVKLPSRSIELKPDEVEHYFEEIDPPQSVRDQWAAAKEPKRFRESYTKHPKTFVRVGKVNEDRTWIEPAEMFLEIMPEKDPTTLRAGDDFGVRVLRDGKPLPDFSLGIVAEGQAKGIIQKTDASGRTSFKLDKAGRWLLRGTDLRPSTKPDLDWESHFATLTIEVAK